MSYKYNVSNDKRESKHNNNITLSVIIPTYNESENILHLIKSIKNNIYSSISMHDLSTEVIVVDDNSPDGTADLVESYAKSIINYSNDEENSRFNFNIKIVRRDSKRGLASAILDGLKNAEGKNIVVMDADLSHPSELIPIMLDELINDRCDLVIASRYVNGGSTVNWSIKRKIISRVANLMARKILGLSVMDAVSGFFACKRYILDGIEFNTKGYKILLEILVKTDTKGIRVKEIPYIFINRSKGESKLDSKVVIEYLKSLWMLYRYGRKRNNGEKRRSLLFLSRAARFYTVGAVGLVVNYLVSSMINIILANPSLATLIGIIISMTSNFILNKAWTFEDTDFTLMNTLKQYAYYTLLGSIGGALQFAFVYLFNQIFNINYSVALLSAIALASVWNFLSNKRWTFKDKIWG